MDRTIQKILNTTNPDSLFDPKEHSQRKHKNLLRRVHPDMFDTPETKEQANTAFIKLNILWEQYTHTRVKKTPKNTVTSKKHTYTITTIAWRTQTTTTLNTNYDDGHKQAQIIIPNNPKHNEQHRQGTNNLNTILKAVPPTEKPYYPFLEDRFKLTNKGTQHQATVTIIPENMYTLQQVKEDYPEGINDKDIAWIYRRLLYVLALTHDTGYTHNAINLNHVLIHPEHHGLTLTNWEYSTETNEPLKNIPIETRNYYPEKFLTKAKTSHVLDIHLAAKTISELLTKNSDRRMKAFLKGCMLTTLPTAGELLQEYDQLLEQMWGERKYHPFKMKRTN